jgi:DNA-binding transcriptional regulator YdaS (Cro superfamily)
MKALDRAIMVAGSQAELARRIGAGGQSTVGNWILRGGLVPVEYCTQIEVATGVTRKELRPDDWQRYWPELAAPELHGTAQQDVGHG